MSASSDWSLTPCPSLSLVRVRSSIWAPEVYRPGAGDGSWLLLPLSHFSVSRPSSHYTQQTNKYKSLQCISSQYLHCQPSHSGLSQSDLINSWHKTGPANRTAQHRRRSSGSQRGEYLLRSVTMCLEIVSLSGCLVWPQGDEVDNILFWVLTPEPPWHLIMAGADEACDRPD